MNTKNIQPTPIFTPNGEKTATILALTDFYGYHFNNDTGQVTYQLLGMESPGTQIDENKETYQLPESAIVYFSGTIEIPPTVIQQWGTSDDIIWTYVLDKLELTTII